MRSFLRLLPLFLLIAALGCHQRRDIGSRDMDLLTQEEMLDHHFTNLHDAISAVRARWLVVRGTDSFVSPSEVIVYFDQTRLGGVDQLRSVAVNSVAWVRHYNGVDATQRYGVGHSAGVILVSSQQ